MAVKTVVKKVGELAEMKVARTVAVMVVCLDVQLAVVTVASRAVCLVDA